MLWSVAKLLYKTHLRVYPLLIKKYVDVKSGLGQQEGFSELIINLLLVIVLP